ncbi:transcription factor HES-1-B-like isoform X2 [Denticeps clupeoides]|uniref:transcription factor HES-1-B-like isoform X2 n=1 Tax=Denticeps clupeoides TaxID=299321 RepID=UPI0010A402A4|nr:transcription factor HES-1-B-like isoform X2 [Denticeps clupeoides]
MPSDMVEKPRAPPEHRKKSSKPIMEKRRRARINESLCQLKTLILEALRKDVRSKKMHIDECSCFKPVTLFLCKKKMTRQTSRHSKLEKADILEMTVRHLKTLQRAQMAGTLTPDSAVFGKFRAGFGECVNEVTRFLSTCEGVDAEVRTRLLGHLAGCASQLQPRRQVAAPALLQLVPAADGKLALLIPAAALASGGQRVPGGAPASPQVCADSVWRPW